LQRGIDSRGPQFWRKKKASNFAQTSGVLNRLIRLSIETGLLTSVTATVETILWVGWHEYNYHFTLFVDSIYPSVPY
jgi:hypothetical protein